MQNNFNFIAPVYDLLASLVIGRSIRHSQTWLLPFLPANSSVLIIGGGTGWLLEELGKHQVKGSILYLEASEKMLAKSQERYAKLPKNPELKIEFRLGTEKNLKPAENFDVIFTPFLLDLFEPKPLQLIMQQLFAALKPQGLWLVADFAPQNASLFWQKSLMKSMVLFFKMVAGLQANQLPNLQETFRHFPLRLQQ